MKYLLLLSLCAWSACASDWSSYFFDYRFNQYVSSNTNSVGGFNFRTYSTSTGTVYLAGLLTTRCAAQDLRGKTITLRAHFENTGNPVYVARAYNTWNTGPIPPHFRVFFTTNSATFSIGTSNGDNLAYWWSQPGAVSLSYLAGVPSVTITIGIETNLWSAAHGQSSVTYSNEFQSALSRVGQYGITFGGGSFYDVGVAALPGAWSSRFVLDEFTLTEPQNDLWFEPEP